MVIPPTIVTAVAFISFALPTTSAQEKATYLDGRPDATLRYEARDSGVVLPFGKCPQDCDMYGARSS
jgi:hypothetical protein